MLIATLLPRFWFEIITEAELIVNIRYAFISPITIMKAPDLENYPSQLTVKKANTSNDLANYLDLTFIIESNSRL